MPVWATETGNVPGTGPYTLPYDETGFVAVAVAKLTKFFIVYVHFIWPG
jgi:hypothetical protein